MLMWSGYTALARYEREWSQWTNVADRVRLHLTQKLPAQCCASASPRLHPVTHILQRSRGVNSEFKNHWLTFVRSHGALVCSLELLLSGTPMRSFLAHIALWRGSGTRVA
jgi:hypothetical protein